MDQVHFPLALRSGLVRRPPGYSAMRRSGTRATRGGAIVTRRGHSSAGASRSKPTTSRATGDVATRAVKQHLATEIEALITDADPRCLRFWGGVCRHVEGWASRFISSMLHEIFVLQKWPRSMLRVGDSREAEILQESNERRLWCWHRSEWTATSRSRPR